MIHLRHERMSDEFEKWHVIGLPFPVAFHHFTGVDRDGPHDHPWPFQTFVLKGGYVEEAYRIAADGTWSMKLQRRRPGFSYHVPAAHIHRILELPTGECWTMVLPGAAEREVRFWRFGDRVLSRAWHEAAFG